MSALQDREQTASDAPFVRSLDRGLGVLRAFDAAHPRLILTEPGIGYRWIAGEEAPG